MKQDQTLPETALLLEHLAAASRQRLPLPALISRLAEGANGQRHAPALAALAEALSRGEPLGEALQAWPRLGRSTLSAWLSAAEERDQLPEALAVLSGDVQLQERSSQRVRIAWSWPSMVLLVTLIVAVIVSLYVIPQMREAYDSLGMSMPLPTWAYFYAFSFPLGLPVPLTLLALVTVVWLRFDRTDRGDRWLHRLRLDRDRWDVQAQLRLLPVIAADQPHAAAPEFLLYLEDTTPVSSVRKRLGQARARMDQGTALAVALEQERLLPAAALAHLDVAKRTHNLHAMTSLLTQQLHDRWTLASVRFERNLNLVVYLVAAWLALTLLVAVYLPIFRLGQAI
jgi:type II secretory pathway component PulF